MGRLGIYKKGFLNHINVNIGDLSTSVSLSWFDRLIKHQNNGRTVSSQKKFGALRFLLNFLIDLNSARIFPGSSILHFTDNDNVNDSDVVFISSCSCVTFT